jgi:hypothetical protein
MPSPLLSASEFAKEFFRSLQDTLAVVEDSNKSLKPWTAGVKEALRRMGKKRNLCVYPSPERWYESEYLLDLIWLDERKSSPRRGVVELAAEIEWGRVDDVRYDFEKLILVKAPLKLMVCDPWSGNDAEELLPTLSRSLEFYADHRRGETYLVADLEWNGAKRQLALRSYVWEPTADGRPEGPEFVKLAHLGPERLGYRGQATET